MSSYQIQNTCHFLQSIPADMEFHASTPACYKSKDENVVIQEEDEIRLKIVGIRVDATDIFAIGTLMDDYLGETYFPNQQNYSFDASIRLILSLLFSVSQ